jgi:AcrR family transcriptional regulator
MRKVDMTAKKKSARKGPAVTVPSSENRREITGRSAWLEAAQQALLEGGIAGVQVGKLARRLGVTRGGFYWFFESQKQLLDELLGSWEKTSTTQMEELLQRHASDGRKAIDALFAMWIDEKDYKPAWDAAIREWARTSSKVARAVHRVDDRRIAMLHQIFTRLGFKDPEALIRARITYYHQVGYYALGVRETRKTRFELAPVYARVLTGRG